MRNKLILFLTVVFAAFACSDVTDIQPYTAISEQLAFESPEKIELSMAGVYDAAQSGFYGGNENNNRGYVFGAAHIQQNDMRGEDMLLINIFYGFTYEATYTPTTANNVGYWENGFRLVNLANLFMDGVRVAGENGVISEEEALAYEAEARVLRAMAYHEMVIQFARPYRDGNGSAMGLPLRDVGVNSSAAVDEQLAVDRASVAETYQFILDDLDFAETNLPVSRADYPVTRAVKAAAIALKTRVKLHMGDWSGVITEGNKLVSAAAPFTSPSTAGSYALTASVRGPWDDNESAESIFSMEMSANDNLNVNAALANMYGSSAAGARGEVAISPVIWNETFWHADDLRRTALVQSGASGRLFTDKYNDYINNTDFSPIIRYAEVLLNVAEAEARSGDQTRALALLNAVRDRAISGTMTSYTGLSGNALTTAILQERRIEFLAEGQRWKDIHRNAVDPDFSTGGIPAKMISGDVDGSTYVIGNTNLTKNINAIPYSDFRFLWPLPTSELSTNPTLAEQQNPGY